MASYEVTLHVNDKIYKSKAETFLAAFEKLNPPFFKSKSILQVKKGKKVAELLIYIPRMRQLFGSSSVTRQIVLQRLENILKFK